MTRWIPAFALALLVLPAGAQDDPKPQDPYKAKTEKHKKDVLKLRGLDFKREVTVGAYSKKELLEFIKEEFNKELPKDKALRYQHGYAKFGLIPADLDLYDALVDLLSSSIAGFYHPTTKELRLIKPGEGDAAEAELLKAQGLDMEAITLVHELTHAAQDQHFELSTLPLEDETNDDLILALKCVIEGDASAVGWKFGFRERFNQVIAMINAGYKTGQLPGKAGELPAYLRQWLTFPYGYGTDFVLKMKAEDFKEHSRLFGDFPLSSEQILHPAKYYTDRDNPTLVTLPDVAKLFGGSWKESFNNVHGEFVVQILLKEFRSDRLKFAAIKAAHEGWDGDRYTILEDDKGGVMYVWYSTWDSEEDAKQFHEAYALALEKKHGKSDPAGPEAKPEPRPLIVKFPGKDGLLYLERRGADVLVLEEATEAMIGKVSAIWDGAKKTEMKGIERIRKFVCAKCSVKEAFSGNCSKCGAELKFDENEGKPAKTEPGKTKPKKKEYRVGGSPE